MKSSGNVTVGADYLAGKVGVVTGGATLLGRGVVAALTGAGAAVTVVDVDESGADRFGEGPADVVLADVTDDAALCAVFERVVDLHGRLDFLVNLACRYDDQGAGSTREQWMSTLSVNVVSAARAACLARPFLAAGGGGAIVNISSVSSKVAQTGRWTYPASKAALVQLTRSMALDFAPDRIRVNSVSPGWTWSAVMEALSGGSRDRTDQVAEPFHMTGRAGDPAEVGAVVSFLVGDAASVVTGADWAADGGYSAMGPEQAVSAIPLLSV